MVDDVAQIEKTFPVSWDSVDVPATASLDRMHFPYPLSPMTGSLLSTAFVYGHRKASREYHLDVRFFIVMINHYRYDGVLRPEQVGEVGADDHGMSADEAVGQVMRRQVDRWQDDHLPALEAHLLRLRQIDPRGLGVDLQLSLLDEIHNIESDLWVRHFRIVIPMMFAMQVFSEFYTEALGGTQQDAQGLLVGTNSKSVVSSIALGDLAATARSLGLESLFRATPVDQLQVALEASVDGRAFLQQLSQFLDVYGLRSDLFDLATPTWQENPSIALATIVSYLKAGIDARAAQMEEAGRADAAVASAREKLAAYPVAMREQFEMLLQAARFSAFLQEEHNFYIDQQGSALIRLALLRFGDDLVERGLLADRNDVFMLTEEELREVISQDVTRERQSGVQELVSTRRREMEIAHALEPPPFVGPPPEGPPDLSNPFGRAIINFHGGPPRESDDPSTILGNPGSRGSITGIAHVARSLDEAKDLRPGEILVATTTMPAWTPLFGIAAAVVTETGGSLSHCAIVAREYGLPAVVGARGATRRIVTGQKISVDGTQGVVTLH